jgi:hypothetical protein
MNTPRARIAPLLLATAAAATAFLGGCAVSPDYSHYDWAARGGMVEEQDRALASARIEPFQSGRRFARSEANEPLTPPGAPTAREQEIVIDPAAPSRPIVQRRSTTVVAR